MSLSQSIFIYLMTVGANLQLQEVARAYRVYTILY